MIINAILKINPKAKVVVRGNNIDTCKIDWIDETTPISKNEIKKILPSVIKEQTNIENRRNEYPSIEDCIHALLDGGATLKNLQAKRKIIKEKFPKWQII